jgi:hypothetical protein
MVRNFPKNPVLMPILGAVLEGMYADGCTSDEESRIRGRSGRAGGLDETGIVLKDPRVVPTGLLEVGKSSLYAGS